MRVLNVARVITRMPLGGIEKKIIKFFEISDRKDFSYSLICLHEEGPLFKEAQKLGIPAQLIKFRSRLDPAAIRRLAEKLRKDRIDIIHSHMYRANTSGTVSALFARVPVIISHMHNMNTWDTNRQLIMDRILNRYRDRIIAVSRAVAGNLTERVKAPAEKIEVIHNGVDLREFKPGKASRELKESLGLGGRDKAVGFIARLVPQKAPELFIKSAKILLNEKKLQHVKFIVAGGGKLENKLRQMVRDWGLEKDILILGERRDVDRIMSCLDVFVLPSFKEGFSNVLLEAMATGLPAIVTDVGGNAEAIEDGENGFVIPPLDNLNLLTERLERLLWDGELIKEMSRKSLERVQEFSMQRMREKTEALYRKVWQEKRTN